MRSELGRKIEEFGEDRMKCFILHMFLDIIKRDMRYKDSLGVIEFEIYGPRYHLIFDEEVKMFMEKNYDRIIEDIVNEKFRKENRLKRVGYGMLR